MLDLHSARKHSVLVAVCTLVHVHVRLSLSVIVFSGICCVAVYAGGRIYSFDKVVPVKLVFCLRASLLCPGLP